MHKLHLHPGCSAGPVTSISASVFPTSSGCRVQFRLHGDLPKVRIPGLAESERADNLWKTTCFEVFWQPQGTSAYREFNLSPSSRWAAYDFDDFRENGRDAPIDAIAVASAHSNETLLLTADIAADLPLPAMVALNAIVEDSKGVLHFWALSFRDGPPEFHSVETRSLRLDDLR